MVGAAYYQRLYGGYAHGALDVLVGGLAVRLEGVLEGFC
jgi:hypothetical protein